jgi:hypothetical protein
MWKSISARLMRGDKRRSRYLFSFDTCPLSKQEFAKIA